MAPYRVPWRQAAPCLGLGVWALVTLAHFLAGPGPGPAVRPRPGMGRMVLSEGTQASLPSSPAEGSDGWWASSTEPTAEEEVETAEVLLEEVEAARGYEAWWQEQLERRVRVAETCAREKTMRRADRGTFLYDPEHRLLFCRNAKVGTTTWLAHFLELAELPDGQEQLVRNRLHAQVPRLFPVREKDPSIGILAQATISFSMVRHPFERLVSAYNGKVVKGADPWYKWVREELEDVYGVVSFPAFVHMVLDQSKQECPSPGRKACTIDKHWRPFISRCGYCTTHYTVIAKAETFTEDIKYISRLANVTFDEEVQKNHNGLSTSEMSVEYFRQVPVRYVKALYRQYKVDFDMFGYSPDSYIALAKREAS